MDNRSLTPDPVVLLDECRYERIALPSVVLGPVPKAPAEFIMGFYFIPDSFGTFYKFFFCHLHFFYSLSNINVKQVKKCQS